MSGRDYARVVLSMAVVLGVVLATALLPVLSGVSADAVPEPMGDSRAADGGGGGGAGPSGGDGTGTGTGTGGGDGAGPSDGGGRDGTPSDSRAGGDGTTAPNSRESGTTSGGSGSGGDEGGGGGGLGALSVGERSTVGGANESAYRSTSQEVHFVVETDQPTYWRTAAFDRYTGDGWRSTLDDRPYVGSRLRPQGARDRRVVQQVTLRRPTTDLPAAWRPTRLAGPVEDVRVTDARAFRTPAAVPANTTYAVVSHEPPRDPGTLRSTGTDYPDAVERRYTRAPESTDRLGAFTDDLTEDADSPYEQAVRIERWLEGNKRYSLNASHSGGDVATQFVFEMERGYCEYFATAMATMLRSQNVPARYVVGYSTGEPRGDRYVVRGMNAHAWVEVYFPDVGWVRFDPTPGGERLTNESRAFSGDGAYDHTESGSPGESFSAGDTGSESDGSDATGQSDSGGDEGETESSDADESSDSESEQSGDSDTEGPGYDIELNESSLVPGMEVTVTVTRDGRPAADETVLFNGDPVGRTNAEGNVTGVVPYESTLNVSVRTDAAAALDAPPSTDGRAFDARLPPPVRVWRAVDARTDRRADASDTFGVETNATIGLAGPPIPGETVTARVTVRDRPVPEATVRLDGSTVGRTNGSGAVRVTLPTDSRRVRIAAQRGDTNASRTVSLVTDLAVTVTEPTVPSGNVTVHVSAAGAAVSNATVAVDNRTAGRTDGEGDAAVTLPDVDGNVTVVATRGVADGNATVRLERLTVAAEPTLPVAFPWTGLHVRTELDGDPVGGVQVHLNGRPVGETTANGTLTATYPPAIGAMVVASGYSQTVRTDAGTPAVGPALLVCLSGLAVLYTRRRGTSARDLLVDLSGTVVGVCRRTAALIVAGAAYVDAVLARLVAVLVRLREDVRALPGLVRTWLRAVHGHLLAVARRARSLLERLRARLVVAGAWLAALRHEEPRTLARAFYSWLAGLLSGHTPTDAGGVGDGATRRGSAAVDDESEAPRPTIREVWREFLGYVSVTRWTTMTPSEVASRAVERDDLPADAVTTLRDAFRDVEYGQRSPDERLDGAHEALERIRHAAETPTEASD